MLVALVIGCLVVLGGFLLVRRSYYYRPPGEFRRDVSVPPIQSE